MLGRTFLAAGMKLVDIAGRGAKFAGAATASEGRYKNIGGLRQHCRGELVQSSSRIHNVMDVSSRTWYRNSIQDYAVDANGVEIVCLGVSVDSGDQNRGAGGSLARSRLVEHLRAPGTRTVRRCRGEWPD
jgi:hypothetical protein